MRELHELLIDLDVDPVIAECMTGHVRIPIPGWTSPPEWYGFPPALVPVASYGSGPSYLGIWKHWFSKRTVTFVKMYVELGHQVIEVARSSRQFFEYMVVSAIVANDGINAEIRRFADAVGVINLTELDGVATRTGDEPAGLFELPSFHEDPPLASVTKVKEYGGDFPTGVFVAPCKWCDEGCSFEVPESVLANWPHEFSKPQWLELGPKADLFYGFVRSKDFKRAWLTLNSSGWDIPTAVTAIQALAEAVDDPAFRRLARSWISKARLRRDCY